MNDGSDGSHRTDGYHNSWKTIAGPPSSRARWAIAAAMLPPAESPATAIRVGVGADLGAVLGDPQRCGPSVFDGGGIRVLGRQPVVDGHHDRVGAHRMLAAGAVVGVEVADHEAAAVEEQHDGQRATVWNPVGGQ